jgi:hypothetical protein
VLMLEKEYAYFKKMRPQLLTGHLGEFAVIKEEAILGYYRSDVEALRETQKVHPVGTFIVQRCVPENEEVQKFHSRVAFV